MSNYTYSTPVPGAALYGQATNAAKAAYQRALARVGNQRSSLLRQYGYQADFDEAGKLSNLRVDAANPYGQYQQYRNVHAGAAEVARNQVQARGLSGGLAKQAESNLRYGWGADDSKMGQEFLQGIAGTVEEQQQAKSEYDSALYQAELEQARAAIAAQMFNQANYEGLDYPDYGAVHQDTSPVPAANPSSKASGFTSPAKPLLMPDGGQVRAPAPRAAPEPARYYTTRAQVNAAQNRLGGTVKFRAGRGYYLD